MNWVLLLLGEGRTSINRGFVGMTVAPAIFVLLLPLPLFAISLAKHSRQRWIPQEILSGGLAMLAVSFFIASIVTIFVAMPFWLALRRLRRESGLAYALGGATVGILTPLFFIHAGLDFPTSAVLLSFALCAFIGTVVALTFWSIARVPPVLRRRSLV